MKKDLSLEEIQAAEKLELNREAKTVQKEVIQLLKKQKSNNKRR